MPPYDTINLHPVSHSPSTLTSTIYDVICIGSGWAANIISERVLKAGMTALIVEAELFGGDCPFWACVPSKVLLRPAEALQDIKAVAGAREALIREDAVIDASAVFQNRDRWTSRWNDDSMIVPLLEKPGITLVRGLGRIVGEKQVEVKNSIEANALLCDARQAVVLCTGSEPIIPNIQGILDINPWTNRDATSTSSVPESLCILGAGAVGCEMASAFASLGSKVSLISSSPELLPQMDTEAGAIVRQRFSQRGITIYLSTRVLKACRGLDGAVTLQFEDGNYASASQVLLATGRRAVTRGLGLEQLGIDTDAGPLNVDDSLRVSSVPGGWLYAAGDVNGRHPMSHGSKYHGRIVANAIISRVTPGFEKVADEWSSVSATADHYAVPQVIFTLPEVASVGLTRQTAKANGRRFRAINAPVKTEGAQLRASGFEDGWAQWIIDLNTNKLIGATFVGDNVAELLHASTMAIVGGLTLDRIAHAIPSFPTMSEVYLNLLEAAGV